MKKIHYVVEYYNEAFGMLARQEFRTHQSALEYQRKDLTATERAFSRVVIEERFVPGHD